MKAFIQRNLFAVAIAFLGLILTTATCATTPGTVVLASQADSRILANRCVNQPACAVVDAGWNYRGFTCSDITVDSAALLSATDSILAKPGDGAEVSNLPEFVQNGKCQGTKYSFNNGQWTLFYSISTKCNCPSTTTPECSGATQLSEKACNIATYETCGLASNTELKTPCTAN